MAPEVKKNKIEEMTVLPFKNLVKGSKIIASVHFIAVIGGYANNVAIKDI